MRPSTVFLSVLLFCATAMTVLAATPYSGSILALDQLAGPGGRGYLFAVNQANGYRTVISDFGDSSQGILGIDPSGMTRIPAGLLGGNDRWLITDASGGTDGRGALYEVDLSTGMRTLVSDLGDPQQGPLGLYPEDALYIPPALLAPISGTFVVDPFGGTDQLGAVFKIGANGRRSLMVDFGDHHGPKGFYPTALAWRPGLLGLGGRLLVVDSSAGTHQHGALFAVDPINKARTVLSDFGNPNQGWTDPRSESGPVFVLTAPNGGILVLVSLGGTDGRGAIVQVDPTSGYRNLVSDLGNAGQGPVGEVPVAMSWSANRQWLYVVDAMAGTDSKGLLLQVDPVTGSRLAISNFGSAGQGPEGEYPSAVETN
ncbi:MULTISPECIES: hypothetical protein [unclassified Lysobacter]|uniref:hypothetical protein n=1 Tax=unclassified Lysobacter TaxID=2635362 RepID=UPI001BEAE6A7|nr:MULTISPECIES: hypothetical protein [unclassified Lysobacter]MBT2748720.1 hypothetical protein [Lysobacter sp. ISL-42]MBT2751655.1 hypothetical protein [Lysobacter sp. ISL-50]MBT2775849.1 hypothetical protein [Lysobacter sp. ISL-54]MBT2782187.1 hypothetical protein [Lysobacter sp. ISL-52]